MSSESSQLEIRDSKNGVVFGVKVRAGGRRNSINGIHAGKLKIEVTQVPEGGKANKEVIKLLATRLAVAKSLIQLESGASSSSKSFSVSGISRDDFIQRISKKAGT